MDAAQAGDIGGRNRDNLQRAIGLLTAAGYELRQNVLYDPRNRKPVTFEIMVTTREQERIALALVRDIKRAGIEASVRSVDAVQFDQRRLGYDFDMAPARWDQSLSPGNEQSLLLGQRWLPPTQGTRNFMGVSSPFVDRMIEALLAAARARRFCCGHAHARSRVDVGLLCHSDLQPSRAMDRAPIRDRMARQSVAIGRRA